MAGVSDSVSASVTWLTWSLNQEQWKSLLSDASLVVTNFAQLASEQQVDVFTSLVRIMKSHMSPEAWQQLVASL